MWTLTEQRVAALVGVEHLVKLIEVRVLRHFPLGVSVRDVDATPLHLPVEDLLVVTGWTLDGRLAGLECGLLDAVPVESPATAGRDEETRPGAGCVPASVETDHAHPV